MSCVFCRIVAGELPASIVLKTGEVCAFLDARPLFPGHVLVVPTAHVETLPELAEPRPIFVATQQICRALVDALGAEGTFVAVNNIVSQSVPHVHVHVVPRHKGDGLRGFFWPRHKYASDAERDDYARRIAAALPQGSKT